MLTDAEARDLLHAAADTIEVDAAQPLPVIHRPSMWPMLVAAAAIVAVVVATFTLTDRGSSPRPSNAASPTPAVNRIPPVMGLDPVDAQERLEGVGLVVRIRSQAGCVDRHVAAGTSPAVGSRFSAGDQIELTVLNNSADFCDGSQSLGWDLLRFALGASSAPRLAEELTLYPGSGEPVTLSADEAKDPTTWEVCDGDLCGSALSILVTAATQPVTSGAGPILEVWEQPRSFDGIDPCMSEANVEGEGGTYVGIRIAPPTDGIAICPLVTAFISSSGVLEAVAIPLNAEAMPEPEPKPSADAMAAATDFVAWARGSDTVPQFADRVDLYFGGALMDRISSARVRDRIAWRACLSMVSNCPPPIPDILVGRGAIQFTAGLPEGSCRVADTGSPAWRPDVTLTWRLLMCRSWIAVQFRVNDLGQITAANLISAR